MNRTNVLFLILDSCRTDYADGSAATFGSLSRSNISFENAYTPGSWSLPAHAAILSGSLPHETGVFDRSHQLSSVPPVERLSETGYDTYAVSANLVFSDEYGFNRGFDEFHVTNRKELLSGDGVDPAEYTTDGQYTELLRAALTAENRRGSVANLAGRMLTGFESAVNSLNDRVGYKNLISRPFYAVPHALFERNSGYSDRGATTTNRILSILRDHDESSPFFIIANYMDTHRPYYPPTEFQRAVLGEPLSHRRLTRLNEEYASPWNFLDRHFAGDAIPVETIRSLYRAEVMSVDEQIRRIVDFLDAEGLRKSTLLIVTADHGENLGETDEMGRTRMGHVASASENLLNVPLTIIHPNLDAETITEPVSLSSIEPLLTDQLRQVESVADLDVRNTLTKEVVTAQCPATGLDELYDRYNCIPREIIRDQVDEHTVVGYDGDWKVVMDTAGTKRAFRAGKSASISDAPGHVVEACSTQLDALAATKAPESTNNTKLLEDLGYV